MVIVSTAHHCTREDGEVVYQVTTWQIFAYPCVISTFVAHIGLYFCLSDVISGSIETRVSRKKITFRFRLWMAGFLIPY
jgi:hypothetical protein